MSLLLPQAPPGARHAAHHGLNPWPSVTEMLRVKRSGIYNIGRRLKTSAILLQARAHRPTLASAFAEMQWAAKLFQKHPALFKTVLEQYLDLRHGMAQRFHLIANDLRQLHERRERGRLLDLDAERLTLWQDDALGLKVEFDINLESPQEGLWRLTLREAEGHRHVFSLSFAMVRNRAFVGAVQGPKCDEGGQELVRRATRTLHGVRPHFFLVEVLRQLSHAWQAQGLVGVDGSHQLKAAKHSDDHHLVKFDYAAFWQELGGERNEHGHWNVPLQGQRKDMADIESKKRSMYRKRYAMLDELAATVAARA
jgi:uncharacterized protein VirK/YbjX